MKWSLAWVHGKIDCIVWDEYYFFFSGIIVSDKASDVLIKISMSSASELISNPLSYLYVNPFNILFPGTQGRRVLSETVIQKLVLRWNNNNTVRPKVGTENSLTTSHFCGQSKTDYFIWRKSWQPCACAMNGNINFRNCGQNKVEFF